MSSAPPRLSLGDPSPTTPGSVTSSQALYPPPRALTPHSHLDALSNMEGEALRMAARRQGFDLVERPTAPDPKRRRMHSPGSGHKRSVEGSRVPSRVPSPSPLPGGPAVAPVSSPPARVGSAGNSDSSLTPVALPTPLPPAVTRMATEEDFARPWSPSRPRDENDPWPVRVVRPCVVDDAPRPPQPPLPSLPPSTSTPVPPVSGVAGSIHNPANHMDTSLTSPWLPLLRLLWPRLLSSGLPRLPLQLTLYWQRFLTVLKNFLVRSVLCRQPCILCRSPLPLRLLPGPDNCTLWAESRAGARKPGSPLDREVLR